MPNVPLYNAPTIRLVPDQQSDIGPSRRASAESFGSNIGAGMQSIAQGLSHVGQAMQAVQAKEDEARAKAAVDGLSATYRDMQHNPETGFMFKQGRNAVDGWNDYQSQIGKARTERGKGLTGEAAQMYEQASKSMANNVMESGIQHTGQQRKAWFKDASNSRMDTLQQNAIAGFSDPKVVERNIASGIAELQGRGADEGWDAATLKKNAMEFGSTTRKAVVMQMAETDPEAANAYYQKHKDKFTGTDQYAIGKSLDEGLTSARGLRNAGEILQGTRAPPQVGDVAGAKGFLFSRAPGKSHENINGIDDHFATNLASMIQDAPPEISKGLQVMSGFRSVEHQGRLFHDAVAKYGSVAAARKWVAPPGHSEHNNGNAVDLMYNGQRLDKAPKAVQDWVHGNAAAYGLKFPMSWEAWHIEPNATRGGGTPVQSAASGVTRRSNHPSFAEIETKLAAIKDPKERDATRRNVMAGLELQSKQESANQKDAELEVFKVVEQGGTPDDVPIDIRLAAGQGSLSSAWSYHDAKLKHGEPQTDQSVLYAMRRSAAADPARFAQENLMDYRSKLDNAAFKELTDLQTSFQKDTNKAVQDGSVYTTAYKMADKSLADFGIVTSKDTNANRTPEIAKIEQDRTAKFQNALKDQIDLWRIKNNGVSPNYNETQSMINNLLIPIAAEGTTNFKMFEVGQLPATATPHVEFKYIDTDMRAIIATDLSKELGRPATPDEIAERYSAFVLGRKPPERQGQKIDPTLYRPDAQPAPAPADPFDNNGPDPTIDGLFQ
jgi:D-alanyl-D-alanine carboxypeptidase